MANYIPRPARRRANMRRLVRAAAAIVAATGLMLTATPAGMAASGLKPGDSLGCWQYPHPDGGQKVAWTSGGDVRFYERGEYLTVTDTKSNGWRVVALFSWCEGPLLGQGTFHWSPTTSDGWQHRDSGPNQGSRDQKTYNYDFEEGRRIIFRACEKKMSTGQLRNCSNTVEAWA
ncbi:hypothetical protein [Haloactinopolyspora sp.]|uniref:hypothetical protein n=1 Tax=Haloactinopolyspora sp. TaxID=1966353 RepID=UPI00261AAE95|nr:hypothetical protein [Haloactinopolyspora sp.]